MKIWAIHCSGEDCVWHREENAFTSKAKALAYVEKMFERTTTKEIERKTDKYGATHFTFQDEGKEFYITVQWEVVL